jgi:hypothetical protein
VPDNGVTGYLFLVTYGTDTGTLNRQQLLGSMPKMLDGLRQGDEVRIRLIDQAMFAQLVDQLLKNDQIGHHSPR